VGQVPVTALVGQSGSRRPAVNARDALRFSFIPVNSDNGERFALASNVRRIRQRGECVRFVGEVIMSSLEISLVTLAVVFGGALLGMALRAGLPQNELSAESREVVKLGMGLIATMAALVLGLLIASAKSSFDTQNSELMEMSSKVVLLDRVLAHYGPEAKEARDVLRSSVVDALNLLSSKVGDVSPRYGSSANGEVLYDKIQGLSPKDDVRRSIQAQAMNIMMGLGQTRWLLAAQTGNSVSVPMLVVLVAWLTIIFISFGLFAPRNVTVVVSLLVSALSVSGAIFLILEMYSPYAGLIHVSGAPLRAALEHLGH
jgi:hypothetical protein